ncbi:ABC transporter ATP-binding protein [Isobaculum melis]|uniref:ATP-binding cassette, subfamily B n=1 Tax=Isobaculum melis TaxID=142588 RepID=A0A1H9S1P7_9LACT|nr:ABC transporter ATP-binding protein [Isobaculum melis]SER78931.1 ATP-binding cassette, subfamily B [Isobaculum melis]
MENKNEWSESIPVKEQIKIMKRLFVFAKPFKKQFYSALFFGFLLALTNIMLPKIIEIFIDTYLVPQKATQQILLLFAGLYFGTILIKSVFWFLSLYIYRLGSEKTVKHIRDTLFGKLHTLGMRYFDQTPAGSIVSRVTNDTEGIKEFFQVFQAVLQGLFAIMTAFVAMFFLDIRLAFSCLIFLPVLGFIIWYYQHQSSRIYRGMREKLSQLNTKLNESISGMSIIQQFRQEKRLQKEFGVTNDEYLASRYSMIKINALFLGPIISLLYTSSLVVILGFFGYDSFTQPISVGVIYAFITYAQNFFNPMTNMMDYLSVFQDGVVSGSRILKILDNEELAPGQTGEGKHLIQDAKIEFKQVSFSYDGEHDVLHDISFTANPGETVALVGHTGSGKSSIINVMMRFYEFNRGDILIDGVSIKQYPTKELRHKMGLVLQDSFMFYGDIKGNIRLMDDSISGEAIRDAASFVQADRFIEALPGAYDAKVIERGASYSSGQRQLLSFARTIVTDPKILVLDEATANIDTETESLIQEGLRKMRKGRTTIAIAHRLSTIKDANLILVLDKGQIIERGTHDELLAKQGTYYDMYQLQSTEGE